MPNNLVRISEEILQNTADAIREKLNSEETIKPVNFPQEIASISTGIVPTGNINISTNGSHDVTNYSTATVNIDTESHPPITVNITQSEHQTITVKCNTYFGSKTSSGTYSVPSGLSLSATVTPASGYIAGTLNQNSVYASWGDTVSFSATEATVIPVIPVMLGITFTGDTTSLPSSLTIPIYEYGNSNNIIGVTFNAADNWIQTVDLKASTGYKCDLAPTPEYTLQTTYFTTPSAANSSPINLSVYISSSAPVPPSPPTPPA